MMIKRHFHKALTMPPHVTVKKAAGKIMRTASEAFLRRKDRKVSSYAVEYPNGKLYSYFPKLVEEQLLPYAETISGVTKCYLAHCFDLLGSGWVKVKHGMRCRGLEGYRYDMESSVDTDSEEIWLEGRINRVNLEESKRIWKLIAAGSSKLPRGMIPGFHPCTMVSTYRAGKAQSSKERMYIPIDWHLDFKSGYRWREDTWYKDICYGHNLGVDVKVPWELARMQHLPQLAFAYALAAQSSKPKTQSKEHGQETEFENQKSRINQLESPERYAHEFRSQILDFIAVNPPRFGVNWACTMDVGIRVANWLAAYDLFCAYRAEFDREFLKVFKRSIYEHGLHIINNLEWSPDLRSNHYLSDIAGLLFVAAYLPRTPEIDAWLAFAVQELIKEVENQFYPDGGNFEASTSYHRLSAEMVIYATALVLGLPEEKAGVLKSYDCKLIKGNPALKPAPLTFYPLPIKDKFKYFSICNSPFPMWYFERLEKMAEFTMHITKPNNQIPQIGDNDSGRFLKIHPVYRRITVAEAKSRYANLIRYKDLPDHADYWDEDHLDHRSLVAGMNGLFQRQDFTEFTGPGWIDTYLIKAMVGEIQLPSYCSAGRQVDASQVRIGTTTDLIKMKAQRNSLPENSRKKMRIPIPEADVYENLQLFAYPDFGIFLFRSKRLYLALRCGPIGQNDNGGHAHNDQLSLELTIDGRNLIRDPGTYLYTPLPARRNEYRSVTAHYAPQLSDLEPGDLKGGLFCLGNDAQGSCLYFRKDGFIGMHQGYGFPLFRSVMLLKNAIQITDYTTEIIHLEDICQINSDQSPMTSFSPGYGLRHA